MIGEHHDDSESGLIEILKLLHKLFSDRTFAYCFTSVLLPTLYFCQWYVPTKQKKGNLWISLPVLLSLFGSIFWRMHVMRLCLWTFICFLLLIFVRVVSFKKIREKTWATQTLMVVQMTISFSMLRFEYGFPYNFIVLLCGYNFDYVTLNWANILVYILLRKILKKEVRPVVVISKTTTLTSHWYVRIKDKTYELFKQERITSWKKYRRRGNFIWRWLINNDQYVLRRQKKQRKFNNNGRRRKRMNSSKVITPSKWGLDFVYIPFIQRGLAGIYFGDDVQLSKAYESVIKDLEKENYSLMKNDCQWFCYYFVKKLGITFYHVYSNRFLLIVISYIFYLDLCFLLEMVLTEDHRLGFIYYEQ